MRENILGQSEDSMEAAGGTAGRAGQISAIAAELVRKHDEDGLSLQEAAVRMVREMFDQRMLVGLARLHRPVLYPDSVWPHSQDVLRRMPRLRGSGAMVEERHDVPAMLVELPPKPDFRWLQQVILDMWLEWERIAAKESSE